MPARPNDVARLLRDLARALNPLGVSWYVFGAQAVVLHHVPRFTDDVDVTVELGEVSVQGVVKAMRKAGFQLLIRRNVDEFIRQTRVLPMTHVPSGVGLDLVVGGPGIEEDIAERAVRMSVGGVRVPVARAEDLVMLKILAGRDKDLEDVRGLLRVRPGKINLAQTRTRLRTLELLLDRSDLCSLFEAQVLLIKSERNRRPPI